VYSLFCTGLDRPGLDADSEYACLMQSFNMIINFSFVKDNQHLNDYRLSCVTVR